MRVKDSVVVITGASSGIGRAAALRFAAKGASVVLTARRLQALEEVAAECRRSGAEALVVPADVTDADALNRVARLAVERFGRIDAWVNNAAVTLFASFQEVPSRTSAGSSTSTSWATSTVPGPLFPTCETRAAGSW